MARNYQKKLAPAATLADADLCREEKEERLKVDGDKARW